MYVIKGRFNHYFVSNDRLGWTDDLRKATRFSGVSACLSRLMEESISHGYPWSENAAILKLTITPGATVRREVPLGTLGSKVAVKSSSGPSYLVPFMERSRYFNCAGQLARAELYENVHSAATALVMLDPSVYDDMTLVGVLEETSEETLTATPLE